MALTRSTSSFYQLRTDNAQVAFAQISMKVDATLPQGACCIPRQRSKDVELTLYEHRKWNMASQRHELAVRRTSSDTH